MRKHILAKNYNSVWPKKKATSVDSYYVTLANRLYNRLAQLNLYGDVWQALPKITINLTCYFEDVVADFGLWRMFSALCRERYGNPVPIYHARQLLC